MHMNIIQNGDQRARILDRSAPGITLEDRVRAAALLLDAQVPGWFNRVNTEQIEMLSHDHCILGQVYGAMARRLSDGSLSGYTYGRFALTTAYPGLDFGNEFADQKAAPTWAAEVEARRAPTPQLETPRLEMVEV